MNNELKRIWKEASHTWSRYYPGGLRKIMKHLRIAGIPAEIWIEHLPNVCLKCYCYHILHSVWSCSFGAGSNDGWSWWVTSVYNIAGKGYSLCVSYINSNFSLSSEKPVSLQSRCALNLMFGVSTFCFSLWNDVIMMFVLYSVQVCRNVITKCCVGIVTWIKCRREEVGHMMAMRGSSKLLKFMLAHKWAHTCTHSFGFYIVLELCSPCCQLEGSRMALPE